MRACFLVVHLSGHSGLCFVASFSLYSFFLEDRHFCVSFAFPVLHLGVVRVPTLKVHAGALLCQLGQYFLPGMGLDLGPIFISSQFLRKASKGRSPRFGFGIESSPTPQYPSKIT